MRTYISMNEQARGDRPGSWSEEKLETGQSAVKCRETPSSLHLEIEMPGADAKGLDVLLQGRRLTVKWQKSSETRSTDSTHERVSRSLESRTKEVELPCPVDPGKVEALLKDGVLRVTLAKK